MSQNYTPEFKKKIVRLHEEEGRTYKSITAEYGVSKASISNVENLRLKREIEELRKEIAFLKTSACHLPMALHSLQRKSVRGSPVHRPTP